MCTSSCPTQDHASWGECARSKNLRVGWAASARGLDLTTQKKWDNELAAYKDARAQGIQPSGTKLHQTRNAVDISEITGKAFQADTGKVA